MLLIATTFITFRLYMNKIIGNFIGSNEQIFLHIKVEKENLQSLLAMEQVFTQMHAIHGNFTWAEIYLEGKVNMWVSFEIVSIGGKISYIFRLPKRYQVLVQSAFYAQFPNAEITEISDYMEPLKHWDAEHSNWDLWGTEFKFTKDQAYPIRTWRDFEHPAAENPMIDPVAGLLEALSKAEEHELMAIQFVLRPIQDADWVPHSEKVIKKLKGEEDHEVTFLGLLTAPFDFLGKKTFFEMIKDSGGSHGAGDKKDFPTVQRMSEGEREVLNAISRKMSKTGWEVKIRTLYIAPKDRFDGTKKGAIIGGFRMMSGMTTNSLKPDVAGTWTNYNYKISKTLEAPYTEYVTEHKKHVLLKGFSERSMWIGAKPMIMNVEELATMLHFPLATTSTPPVERIDVKRGQPPQNLPVAY